MTTIREFSIKLGLDADLAGFTKVGAAFSVINLAVGKAVQLFGEFASGVVAAVPELANQAKHLQVLEQQTGASANELQRLGYAADRSETSSEALNHGLIKLSRTMAESKDGAGSQADAFRAIGVRAVDATGKLRPTAAVFNDIADAFEKMPAGAQKTATAMQLFGKGAAELIPLLNEGSAGIKQLGDEAESLGLVLDERAIKSGVRFSEAMEDINAALGGLKKRLIADALPSLTKVIEALAKFSKENAKLIASGLVQFTRLLVAVFEVLAKSIAFLVNHWRLLVSVMVGPLLIAIASVEAASISAAATVAAAWIAAAWPVLAVVAAFVLLGAVLEDVWVFLEGGDSVIGGVIERLGKLREEFINGGDDKDPWWLTALRAIVWFFGDLEHNATEMLDHLGEDFMKFFEFIVKAAAGVGGKILDAITPDFLSDAFGSGATPATAFAGGSVPSIPMAASSSRATSISAPVQINVTQLPGENGADFAARVAPIVKEQFDRTHQEALEAGG